MSKIAITGTSGFIGQNLIQYSSLANEVLKISRNDLENITPQVINDADVVIHLAGKAHDLKKVSDPKVYYQVNFELTKNIYEAFLSSAAKKFIFISSVKAATDNIDGVLTEEFFPKPETDYGKSKLMAEQYIQNRQLPPGKSYYILRPCMIHGPGNKGNLNLLYQFVKKGIPYPLAAFHNSRSFLSVENLCFVIKELIESDAVPSGIYQICDDEPLSTNEVVSILSASMGKVPKFWKVSSQLIKAIAKLGDRLHLPLTTERLNKLTESYVVSNKKITKAIGKNLPVQSRQGLKITAASFANLS